MIDGARIGRNYIYSILGELLSRVFGFIVTVYVARKFGVEFFGKFKFAEAIISYGLLLMTSGLTVWGARETAKQPAHVMMTTGAVMSLRVTLSVIIYAGIVVLAFVAQHDPVSRYIMLILGLNIFTSALNTYWVYQGLQQLNTANIVKIAKSCLYCVLALLLIRDQSQFLRLPWLNVTAEMLFSGGLILLLVRDKGPILFRSAPYQWKGLILSALPLSWGFFMVMIHRNVDTVLLGMLKGDATVGIYSAAYTLVLVVFLVGGFFSQAVFPEIARLHSIASPDLGKLVRFAAKGMSCLGAPIAVAGAMLAPKIISLFYGPSYSAAAAPFAILMVYVGVSFSSLIFADGLVGCHQEKKYAIGITIAALINLTLNLVMIPRFGLRGAASATVVAECFIFGYSYYHMNKIVPVRYLRYMWRPLAASAIMAAGILVLSGQGLFVIIPAAAILYMIAFASLGGVRPAEYAYVASLWQARFK